MSASVNFSKTIKRSNRLNFYSLLLLSLIMALAIIPLKSGLNIIQIFKIIPVGHEQGYYFGLFLGTFFLLLWTPYLLALTVSFLYNGIRKILNKPYHFQHSAIVLWIAWIYIVMILMGSPSNLSPAEIHNKQVILRVIQGCTTTLESQRPIDESVAREECKSLVSTYMPTVLECASREDDRFAIQNCFFSQIQTF